MYKLIVTYSLINCPIEYEELFIEALTTEGFTKLIRCYQSNGEIYQEKSCIAPAGQLAGEFYYDAFRTKNFIAEFISHYIPLCEDQKITYTVAHVNEIVSDGLDELSGPENN
ncbi:hypothetical protein TUM12370_22820 [Salmonella enterica subsp. enterica serovar Choleraesuis]|nr:hypothetical protein TUM12370_22820 [Salmonella enterica subsp. enterica serovar Choleraesuis]